MPAKKPTKKNTVAAGKGRTAYDALFDFQSENIVIPRNGKGRSEKGNDYKYATLDDVISMTRAPLQKHGLVYTQVVFQNEAGQTLLKTVLTYVKATANPTFIETSIPVGKPESTQDMGSRITYMRRYALVPMLGLSIEDDLDAVPMEMHAEMEQPVAFSPEALEPAEQIKLKDKETADAVPKEFAYTSPKAEEALKDTVEGMASVPFRSGDHQKAYNAVMACGNLEAIAIIERKVAESVKLNAAEKADVASVIAERKSKLSD